MTHLKLILVIISFYLLFFDATLGQECSTMVVAYNLLISEHENCTISSNLQTLDKIHLFGTLIIQPKEDIYFQYNQLIFGENGELIIYASTLNFSVTFHQLTDLCNKDDLKVGQITVQTAQREGNLFTLANPALISLEKSVASGSNFIQLEDAPKRVSLNQIIELHSIDPENDYHEVFQVKEIHQNKFFLDRKVEFSYSSYEDKLLPKPLLLLLETREQISFKYACFSINSLELKRIAFIDPIYLYLVSGLIEECLFISQYNRQNQEIFVRGSMNRNIFKGFNESVTIISQIFDQNIIINSDFFDIQTHYSFRHNILLSSTINLSLIRSKVMILNCMMKQSTLKIDIPESKQFERGIDIKQLKSINSTLSVLANLIYFRFSNCIHINSTAALTSVEQQITITDSYIFTDSNEAIPFKINYLNSTLQIKLENSTVKGQSKTLFQEQIRLAQSLWNKAFNTKIYLRNNTIYVPGSQNEKFSFLFDIRTKQFFYQSRKRLNYQQIEVEEYNTISPYLLSPRIFSLSYNNQMSLYGISYYIISNVTFTDSDDPGRVILYHNNNFKQQFDFNETVKIQITSFQIQTLYFKTSKDILTNPDQFLLKILQPCYENANYGRYHLLIQFEKQQSKSIEIVAVGNNLLETFVLTDSPKQLTSNLQVYFIHNTALNQLEIYWYELKCEPIELTVKLLFCEAHQILEEGMCVENCNNGILSGFYCDNQNSCQHGYFKNLKGKCQKCPYGCKKCETELTCIQCFSKYFYDNHLCVDTCIRDQYYSNQQCHNCIENCQICENISEINSPYYENCTQCEFVEECSLSQPYCDHSCLTCAGRTHLDCLSCHIYQVEKYGICSVININ